MELYKNLKRVAKGELMILDSQLEGKNEFTKDQAEKFECITHGYKSLLCIIREEKEQEAMENMSEIEGPMNVSERRGRNMDNGRFMSRTEEHRASYMSGFEDGVHAANEGASHNTSERRYDPYIRHW